MNYRNLIKENRFKYTIIIINSAQQVNYEEDKVK